ncbi:MAG: isoprenylcysteine carboxylmethyltransferase family protein [Caldilineaceae bacterium]
MKKLIIPTLRTFVIGAIALGLFLFLPAWTLTYWQAWLFIGVFMTSVNAIGVYLSLQDPALLARRKKFGPAAEQNTAQKIIISVAILSNVALLVFCALDYRLGWSPVPPAVSLVGDGLVALGLLIDLFVFRQNSYGGSTIETVAEQRVITTGLYALVRHPMYVGVLVLVAGVPLALGSWWGLWILVLTIPVLMWRIRDEEKLLEQELAGYREYEQKVPYRLVPYLW